MSNLRTHYNFKLDFRKAEQHTGCCCCCCCVAFAQISGWLIKWSSCWLIFIVSFNTLYNSYYPVRHGLQYVHIFVLANVFVFEFFIYPGGFFTFFYNVLLGFRGVLAISASGVLLEFVFFLFIFTGSIDVLVFMMALHSFLLSFSKYSGLLLMDWFSMFSHQCFIFVLFSASSWVLVLVISIIFLFMLFFISFFEHFAIWSFTLNSSRIPLALSI